MILDEYRDEIAGRMTRPVAPGVSSLVGASEISEAEYAQNQQILTELKPEGELDLTAPFDQVLAHLLHITEPVRCRGSDAQKTAIEAMGLGLHVQIDGEWMTVCPPGYEAPTGQGSTADSQEESESVPVVEEEIKEEVHAPEPVAESAPSKSRAPSETNESFQKITPQKKAKKPKKSSQKPVPRAAKPQPKKDSGKKPNTERRDFREFEYIVHIRTEIPAHLQDASYKWDNHAFKLNLIDDFPSIGRSFIRQVNDGEVAWGIIAFEDEADFNAMLELGEFEYNECVFYTSEYRPRQ
jgi:hypothetical protein